MHHAYQDAAHVPSGQRWCRGRCCRGCGPAPRPAEAWSTAARCGGSESSAPSYPCAQYPPSAVCRVYPSTPAGVDLTFQDYDNSAVKYVTGGCRRPGSPSWGGGRRGGKAGRGLHVAGALPPQAETSRRHTPPVPSAPRLPALRAATATTAATVAALATAAALAPAATLATARAAAAASQPAAAQPTTSQPAAAQPAAGAAAAAAAAARARLRLPAVQHHQVLRGGLRAHAGPLCRHQRPGLPPRRRGPGAGRLLRLVPRLLGLRLVRLAPVRLQRARARQGAGGGRGWVPGLVRRWGERIPACPARCCGHL